MSEPHRLRRGFILPAVVVIIFLLTVVGLALLEMSRGEAVLVMKDAQYLKAFNLAEAGIERALWKMADEPEWAEGFTDAPLGDGTYSVTVTPLGSKWYMITSTGIVGRIGKTLMLRAKVSGGLWPPAFDYALFWGNPSGIPVSAVLKENVGIDGSVFCYGSLEIGNNASVTGGEVYSTGTVTGGGTYTVGEMPDPPPERLQFDTSYYDALIAQAAAQPKGNWKLTNGSEYALNGQTLLVNGDVDVANSSAVRGPGKIVATGNITFGNKAAILGGVDLIAGKKLTLNNCSQIECYGNVLFGRLGVTLENNCATTGSGMFVYTPANLEMTNNGAFRGAFWGGEVELTNNLSIVGSVYADQLHDNKIRNNVFIEHDVLDFQPPPGVPPGVPITVTLGEWAEQEATGL